MHAHAAGNFCGGLRPREGLLTHAAGKAREITHTRPEKSNARSHAQPENLAPGTTRMAGKPEPSHGRKTRSATARRRDQPEGIHASRRSRPDCRISRFADGPTAYFVIKSSFSHFCPRNSAVSLQIFAANCRFELFQNLIFGFHPAPDFSLFRRNLLQLTGNLRQLNRFFQRKTASQSVRRGDPAWSRRFLPSAVRFSGILPPESRHRSCLALDFSTSC